MDFSIRPWELTDIEALAAALNNPLVQANLRDGIPLPYTAEDAWEYIRTALSADKNQDFAFAVTADGRVAGSISARRQPNIHCRTAEMGYFIAQPYWGRGCATAAVQQTCAFLFATTDILRIFAEPFAHNAASCRVLEKSGFQLEGVMRRNAYKGGQVLDMKLYALLKD